MWNMCSEFLLERRFCSHFGVLMKFTGRNAEMLADELTHQNIGFIAFWEMWGKKRCKILESALQSVSLVH